MLTVRLPADLEGEVARIASTERRTESEIVEDALRQYIASHQQKRSSYKTGQDLFGTAASGEYDRSQTCKRRIKEKLREKRTSGVGRLGC